MVNFHKVSQSMSKREANLQESHAFCCHDQHAANADWQQHDIMQQHPHLQ